VASPGTELHQFNAGPEVQPHCYDACWTASATGNAMAENILEYYGNDSLSTIFHDFLANHEPGCKTDIGFYASLLHSTPANILELGCGSGRVSLALAKRGHRVEGIDIAQPMLARAELQKDHVDRTIADNVTFTVADMTSFSIPMKYDLIIAPYFALNHLPDGNAVRKTFLRVAEHLSTGGTFALHLANVSRLGRALSQEAKKQVVLPYGSAGWKLRLEIVQRRHDQITGEFVQIFRYTTIDPDGIAHRTSTERLKYRAIVDEELETAACQAHLTGAETNWDAGESGRFLTFRRSDQV
jgi:SAM-dependent methyltransferase